MRFDRHLTLQSGAIAALLLFSPLAPAYANSDTDAQIQRLENEIQTLSRAVFKGENPPAGYNAGGSDTTQADIQNRLSQMEMNIQALTGKIEEQGNAIATMKDQMARSGGAGVVAPLPGAVIQSPSTGMSSTGMMTPPQPAASGSSYTYSPRANGISSNIPPESPQINEADDSFTMADPDAPAPSTAPTAGSLGTLTTNINQNGIASAATGTPTAEYEAAFTMMRNQDYAAAQMAFESFLKKYPDGPLSANAMYWLGESHYVRNQFAPATKVFAEAYQKYPKGAKAPDNLLKLGLSLAGQGKTKEACIALGQLKKQYPAGSAPVLTRGDQEIARLKCSAQ